MVNVLPRRWSQSTWCRRSLRYCYVIVICCVIGTYLYIDHLWLNMESYYNPGDSSFNYFHEVEHYSKLGLLINTTNCQIPNISAWDNSVHSHLLKLPPVECSPGRPAWTYVNGTELMINTTALIESGYPPNSVSCCFKTITRVTQSLENYDVHADEMFTYSENCEPMESVTQMNPTQEFVKVFCTSKYWPFYSNVAYKNYHAFAQPNTNSESIRKQSVWKTKPAPRPPNVLVLGIDSVSRLSFERQMKRLRNHLNDIGAVELKGYTKIGENTFPNTVAFLTGYFEEELILFCYPNRWLHQDRCPYIWNRFAAADYWTAMVEDVPHVTAFNYHKTGFIHRPVDFYLRPFMLAIYTSFIKPIQHVLTRCIGDEPVAKTLMKYLADLMSMSKQKETPIFVHGWTNVAHDDFNAAQLVDDIFTDFFETVDLQNTIIFFLSDHGYRYGPFRPTFSGWMEDKLPNSWVYLPPQLRTMHPEWHENLLINSGRLTTAFDVYQTLNHIIDTFMPNTPKVIEELAADGSGPVPRRFGQSLFNPVPDSRKCEEDAGVPNNYCACVIPQSESVDDPLVKLAAQEAISHLNSILPSQCHRARLKTITGAAILVKNSPPTSKSGSVLNGKAWRVYIIAFVTLPGDFVFEGNVEYIYNNTEGSDTGNEMTSPGTGTFQITTELLRMNKINTDVSCVNDGVLERICFCN